MPKSKPVHEHVSTFAAALMFVANATERNPVRGTTMSDVARIHLGPDFAHRQCLKYSRWAFAARDADDSGWQWFREEWYRWDDIRDALRKANGASSRGAPNSISAKSAPTSPADEGRWMPPPWWKELDDAHFAMQRQQMDMMGVRTADMKWAPEVPEASRRLINPR